MAARTMRWDGSRAFDRERTERSAAPARAPEAVLSGMSPRTGISPGRILQLQRAVGNGATVRMCQDAPSPQAVARRGLSGAGTRLPHGERIQAAFGDFDLADVRAHDDAAARTAADRLGAVAYASGEHVALPADDLRTTAHEAAHVLQQRAGLVAPGVGAPGDRWERHADAVADAVVHGRSAEPLLRSALGAPAARGAGSTSVQMIKQPKSRQNFGNTSEDRLDELYQDAAAVGPTFYNCVSLFAEKTKGEARCPHTVDANQQPVPLLKGRTRARQKAEKDYKGDYSQIVDLLRATVVYDRFREAAYAAKLLAGGVNLTIGNGTIRWTGTVVGTFDFHAARMKDRLADVPYDYLFNVKMRVGTIEHVCELQFQVREVLDYKEDKGHHLYEIVRDPKSSQAKKDIAQEKMQQGFDKAARLARSKT